jgi:hypothetical protein
MLLLKYGLILNRLDGVISQEIELYITITVRISDPNGHASPSHVDTLQNMFCFRNCVSLFCFYVLFFYNLVMGSRPDQVNAFFQFT